MRFLCIVHVDQEKMSRLSKSEDIALTDRSLEYDDELRRRGHLVTANALELPHTARIVRVRQGKRSVVDGPFIETKEQVGGFLLIEARDLDEAVELAAGVPMAAHAAIEVRAMMEMRHS